MQLFGGLINWINMKKALLIILDGWGIAPPSSANAITSANPQFFNSLIDEYPNATLTTHGEAVGLPKGQMGNSEVGHLNIGAGRVVYQELQRINHAIATKEIFNNKAFQAMITYCVTNDKPLHLMGLVSQGGVHSHLDHLLAVCDYLMNTPITKVYIHAFTDGRDTAPNAALTDIANLQTKIKNTKITLATLVGRYYAMDRDKRWERISLAYQLLVNSKGNAVFNIEEAIKTSYELGVTDEFLKPIINANSGFNGIQQDDAVFCFNFRTDRCREITQALTQQAFGDFEMQPLRLHYTTLTMYDATFTNINVVFKKENIKQTLGETLADRGIKQMRAAETEKYPHVTFFFSGGRELVFEHEIRVMQDSPKVATYNLQPAMNAEALTNKVIDEITNDTFEFGIINYANPDMVGHTGDFDAVVKAIVTVDNCIEKLVTMAQAYGYEIIIIADHGNAECMRNADGSAHTAHTTNLVPIIICNKNYKINNGILADVAPTILTLMQVQQPIAMTGSSLLM
jgi:2,3-bisphosphoglycerate-independent phosphoglycerate mutase